MQTRHKSHSKTVLNQYIKQKNVVNTDNIRNFAGERFKENRKESTVFLNEFCLKEDLNLGKIMQQYPCKNDHILTIH